MYVIWVHPVGKIHYLSQKCPKIQNSISLFWSCNQCRLNMVDSPVPWKRSWWYVSFMNERENCESMPMGLKGWTDGGNGTCLHIPFQNRSPCKIKDFRWLPRGPAHVRRTFQFKFWMIFLKLKQQSMSSCPIAPLRASTPSKSIMETSWLYWQPWPWLTQEDHC